MNIGPLISVLMPVYNCDTYVKEAVESILNQTYTHFELIIIDDASTDNTVAVINSIKDDRIKLFVKPENSGLTNSLNYGLTLAKGKYIARMDGDDISVPYRFEKQIEFLEKNLDVGLCAGFYQVIGEDKVRTHSFINHDEIKVGMLRGNNIAHPTVMIRSEVLKKHRLNYDPENEPAEDFDLWSRMVFITKLANLPEVLLQYRIHAEQTSSVRRQRQIDISNDIIYRMHKRLNSALPEYFTSHDLGVSVLQNKNIPLAIKERLSYLEELLVLNANQKLYHSKYFSEYISNRKQTVCDGVLLKNRSGNLRLCLVLLFKVPTFFKVLTFKSKVKWILKSLVQW